MSELRFEGATVRFGSRRHGHVAVDDVDLVVPSGTVVGLVGESGSGKSTLARAAVGLAPLTAGRVLVGGQPVPRHGRRPVQMVFQDPFASLDPRMTVGESIMEAIPRRSRAARRHTEGGTRGGASAREWGFERSGELWSARAGSAGPSGEPDATAGGPESGGLVFTPRREIASRLAGLVGLPDGVVDGYPARLSGGQRQRVALARALAGRPEVIIADEITSALDVSTQGAVLNVVRDLQRELRLSMLFISHNLAVVRYVSDVVAVMRAGRIVECGPVEQVLAAPGHEYTRELLAAVPRPGSVLSAED